MVSEFNCVTGHTSKTCEFQASKSSTLGNLVIHLEKLTLYCCSWLLDVKSADLNHQEVIAHGELCTYLVVEDLFFSQHLCCVDGLKQTLWSSWSKRWF